MFFRLKFLHLLIALGHYRLISCLLIRVEEVPENELILPLASDLKSRNPSGVNMTKLNSITSDMDNRIDLLENKEKTITKDLSLVYKMSPKVYFNGVDIEADIVDPDELAEVIKKKSEELEVSAKNDVKNELTGKLSPPIIILEAAEETPFEKYLLTKLLSCRQEEALITENAFRNAMKNKEVTEKETNDEDKELEDEEESTKNEA